MKKYLTKLRYLSIALLIAMVSVAASPEISHAQRSRTDKGKVAVKRSGTSSTSKRSTATRSSSGSKKSSNKAVNRSGSRSSKSNSQSARSSDRSQKQSSSATRSSRSNASRDSGGSRAKASGSRNNGSRATASGNRDNSTRATNSGNRDSGSRASRTVRDNTRQVINGARSAVRIQRKAPIVVRKGKKQVRYAPKIIIQNRRPSYRRTSRINVHISWPWVVRYQRSWSPRYRYRQVVHVQARWGSRDRVTRVEMETVYRHRVKYATDDYAVLDIDIEEVALYEGSRYLGSVDRIPSRLSSIEATVYRDGAITFDRDVFIVGDRRAGFEMISTLYYDDYALARYRDSDGLRVGKLNLRSGKVTTTRRSRLFNPRDYRGYAPISLLPENEGWLWDYGVDAISAASDDYGTYYGYADERGFRYRSSDALRSENEYSYSTDFGAQFNVKRQSQIQRVE